MSCTHCRRLILPCNLALPGDPCTVRCLHDHPVLPSDPPLATPRVACPGWVHEDGWHMCDPALSHTAMAEPLAVAS